MGLRKASLLLYFLISLHFLHAISRSSSDPKPNGDAFAGKITELEVAVEKGSSGGGGRGGGGSFGGGGGRGGGGGGGRARGGGGRGGGGIRPIPIYGAGTHHGVNRSRGRRESVNGLLGLASLIGLVLVL